MKYLILIPVLFSFFAISSCTKKKAVTYVNSANLISNTSFENNGQSSFTGWTGDTANHRFVTDVPSGGGYWSLQLAPCWLPCEGYAETTVTGLTGTHNYYFSGFTKCFNWSGKVTLSKKTLNGTVTELGSTAFSNNAWQQKTFYVYNIALLPTDKLIIHLSAGSTETSYGRVLFDKISLQQM